MLIFTHILAFFLGSFVVLMFPFVLRKMGKSKTSYSFSEAEILDTVTKEAILVFKNIDGRTRKYRGSCTVWHDVETGKRCGTLQEIQLSELWTKEVDWKLKD